MQAASALDILVVDDDAPLRDMLTRSFEREGHRITAVADGHAALDEVYEHVVRTMQETLDALAAERRLPIIG